MLETMSVAHESRQISFALLGLLICSGTYPQTLTTVAVNHSCDTVAPLHQDSVCEKSTRKSMINCSCWRVSYTRNGGKFVVDENETLVVEG